MIYLRVNIVRTYEVLKTLRILTWWVCRKVGIYEQVDLNFRGILTIKFFKKVEGKLQLSRPCMKFWELQGSWNEFREYSDLLTNCAE